MRRVSIRQLLSTEKRQVGQRSTRVLWQEEVLG